MGGGSGRGALPLLAIGPLKKVKIPRAQSIEGPTAQNRYSTDYLVRAHCAFVKITNGNIFVTRKDKSSNATKDNLQVQ